jgi:hypothetical protein
MSSMTYGPGRVRAGVAGIRVTIFTDTIDFPAGMARPSFLGFPRQQNYFGPSRKFSNFPHYSCPRLRRKLRSRFWQPQPSAGLKSGKRGESPVPCRVASVPGCPWFRSGPKRGYASALAGDYKSKFSAARCASLPSPGCRKMQDRGIVWGARGE